MTARNPVRTRACAIPGEAYVAELGMADSEQQDGNSRLERARVGGSPCTRSLQSQGNLTLKLTYPRGLLA